MLTGENGILTQAQKAKNETENAASQEEEDLAKLEAMINGEDIVITQVDDDNPGQLEQEDDTTFVINSIEDLVFFSYDVTTNGNKYENQTVKLGTNLDFNSDKSYVNPNRTDFETYGYNGPLKQALTSESGFVPIGEQGETGSNYFYGTFDGDNKAICSLYENININDTARAGLFTINYGKIKNVGIVNANIKAKGVATSVGGLTGVSYNSLTNSYVTGNINVIGSSWMPVGGLCGVMKEEANIENCYNLASINATNIKEDLGDADIGCGGILGQGEANINKCYNKGKLVVNGENNQITVGGIVGNLVNSGNIHTVENCYNNGTIQASSATQYYYSVGGVIGHLSFGSLLNCYNSGDIIANQKSNSDGLEIGGIVGMQTDNISIDNVFNIGDIIIDEHKEKIFVGGVSGGIYGTTNSKITNAYNVGMVNIENENGQYIGSISGNNYSNQIVLKECYYLKGTYDVGVGGSETTVGVTQLDSLDKFPSVLNVVNGDGAFEEDSGNVNNGYPVLKMD